MDNRGLTEEQRMMRESCRAFVDDVIIPFVRENWQREWQMEPDGRLPAAILEGADAVGITWQRPSDAPTDGKHRWAVRLRIFMIVFGIACGATAMALFNPV